MLIVFHKTIVCPSSTHRNACSTGSSVFLNSDMHNSSKRARLIFVWKSMPSYSESTSSVASVELLSVRFARSAAVRKRRNARGLPLMSRPYFRLNSFNQIKKISIRHIICSHLLLHSLTCMKCCTIKSSKSSPPKCVSPAVDFTSKSDPSAIARMDTSKVPPPKSKIRTF